MSAVTRIGDPQLVMTGLKDLFGSEKGILCLLVIVAATVLTGLGQMNVEQWTTFVEIVFGTYAVGKTATGVAGIIVNRPGSGDPAAAPSTPSSGS